MIAIDETYNDMHSHVKEAAGLPVFYHQLTREQSHFFRDFFQNIHYNLEMENKDLLEDLNLIKSDLEAVIEKIKK